KEVGLAKSAAKIGGRGILNSRDELIGELLGPNEGDSRIGPAFENVVPHGLHQVRLAEPGGAVDEQRVVDLAWGLSNCVSRSSGELVGLSDDKIVERIAVA